MKGGIFTGKKKVKKPLRRLNIVFFATGAFAVPSMREICLSGLFNVVGLVTKHLSYDRRGNPIQTPARELAEEFNLEIFYTDDVHSEEFSNLLWLLRPDLLFVCDFGKILSKNVLKAALLGGINLHGSLLPKYRGAAPVHWAIMSGDIFTGVSIIHMTPEIDAGPVIAQSSPLAIGSKEDAEQLENRLADYAADLVLDTICNMASDDTVPILGQLQTKVTKAPRLKKEDGLIRWTDSARQIFNNYRAMKQWPKTFTDWQRSDRTVIRLILGDLVPLDDSYKEIDDDLQSLFTAPMIGDAKADNLAVMKSGVVDSVPHIHDADTLRPVSFRRPAHWQPGVVIRARDNDLFIASGEGIIRITAVQPAGKKMMSIAEFLRGYPMKPGDKLE